MANSKYKIQLKNFAGGLSTNGNSSVIDKNESPCLYNVEFGVDGSVQTRTWGNEFVGDDSTMYGAVLSMTHYCLNDSCNFFPESPSQTNSQGNCITTNYPKPVNYDLFIRSVADRMDCKTYLQYYNCKQNKWITFDTMQGAQPHFLEVFNGKLWYSNDYQDLKWACISASNVNGDVCNFTVATGYPTCSSEYGPYLQLPLTLDLDSNFITFETAGKPNGTITWNGLDTYLPVGTNAQCTKLKICIKRSDGSDCCTIVNGDATNPITLTNNINQSITFADHETNHCCLSGTYYEYKLYWINCDGIETEIDTRFCSSDVRLAECVKGHIGLISGNRLWISDGKDRVWYSKRAITNASEINVPVNVGDFWNTETNHTAIDSGALFWNDNCGKITALVKQGNTVYIHRQTNKGNKIYSARFIDAGNGDGYYSYDEVEEATGASWFRNVSTSNSLQYYIAQNQGLSEIKAYGLFQGFISPTTQDRSDRITETMRDIDFTNGSIEVYDRHILYSGYEKSSNECEIEDCNCNKDNQQCILWGKEQKQNNIVLIYNKTTQTYSIVRGWNVAMFYVHNNELYYGSSIDGSVYKINASGFDELNEPTGRDPITIPSLWMSKQFHFDSPGVAKRLYMFYLDGEISDDSDLTLSFLMDCKTKQRFTITQSNCNIDDCIGLDCQGRICKNCIGKFGKKFNKWIKINEEEARIFSNFQFILESSKGRWRLDNVFMVIEQLDPESGLTELLCDDCDRSNIICTTD